MHLHYPKHLLNAFSHLKLAFTNYGATTRLERFSVRILHRSFFPSWRLVHLLCGHLFGALGAVKSHIVCEYGLLGPIERERQLFARLFRLSRSHYSYYLPADPTRRPFGEWFR